MAARHDAAAARRFIDAMVDRIAAAHPPAQPLNIVGIRTRGEVLAARIASALQARGYVRLGTGVLDITLYRDDLSELGPRPLVRPTELNFVVDGVPMILVDDVLFTGRTVRAALGAIADFGRPQAIRLAVLADRGGRELPIRADIVGIDLGAVPLDQRVKVQLAEKDGIDGIGIEPRAAPPEGRP